jgi:hypothetical protein
MQKHKVCTYTDILLSEQFSYAVMMSAGLQITQLRNLPVRGQPTTIEPSFRLSPKARNHASSAVTLVTL